MSVGYNWLSSDSISILLIWMVSCETWVVQFITKNICCNYIDLLFVFIIYKWIQFYITSYVINVVCCYCWSIYVPNWIYQTTQNLLLKLYLKLICFQFHLIFFLLSFLYVTFPSFLVVCIYRNLMYFFCVFLSIIVSLGFIASTVYV